MMKLFCVSVLAACMLQAADQPLTTSYVNTKQVLTKGDDTYFIFYCGQDPKDVKQLRVKSHYVVIHAKDMQHLEMIDNVFDMWLIKYKGKEARPIPRMKQ